MLHIYAAEKKWWPHVVFINIHQDHVELFIAAVTFDAIDNKVLYLDALCTCFIYTAPQQLLVMLLV